MNCELEYVGEAGGLHLFRCTTCKRECKFRTSDPSRAKRKCAVELPPGPGTHLKQLIAALGIRPTKDCGCEALAVKMDRWGVDGCREHRAEILDALKRNYESQTFAAKCKAACNAMLSGYSQWLNPLAPAASLLDRAICLADFSPASDS